MNKSSSEKTKRRAGKTRRRFKASKRIKRGRIQLEKCHAERQEQIEEDKGKESSSEVTKDGVQNTTVNVKTTLDEKSIKGKY